LAHVSDVRSHIRTKFQSQRRIDLAPAPTT
jgi:hypothetical protein